MSIEKPLPLMVGDKAFYTLTSYDPVEVEVTIPAITDEDIAMALEVTLADMGGTEADLDNPAWIAEHFDGLGTRQQVLDAMRQQLNAMNASFAEQQKAAACVAELSKRLCQSVPPQHLERIRETMRMHFVQQLQEEGTTPEEFMAQTGMTPKQIDAMIEEQAMHIAEGDAALSALAHERKIKIDESEYARFLGLPEDQAPAMIEEARKNGMADDMRETALRGKALQSLVAECSCAYKHETPEESRQRLARMHAAQAQAVQAARDAAAARESAEGGFKLV